MKLMHSLCMMIVCCVAIVSCTEEYVIVTEEGEPMIGVDASLTDELKHHEAILSYTADFSDKNAFRMVSGATVYVTDGIDTIFYLEDDERVGHYFTELVAGKKNTLYRFCADIPDENMEEGMLHVFAESFLGDNVESMDSIVVKSYNGMNDTIPEVFFGDTIEFVYPYFQSLPDPTIVYMPMIFKNDTLVTDTLDKRMIIPVGGYAGFYINGPIMQIVNKEIPVHFFYKKDLKKGDRIRLDMYSISPDYLYFYYSLIASSGSNPLLGAPANVVTNIRPEENSAGWFFTASVVSAETVFE